MFLYYSWLPDHDKAIEKARSQYGPFLAGMEEIGGEEITRICGPHNSLPSLYALFQPDIDCACVCVGRINYSSNVTIP